MEKQKKNTKGITLVALVITIVILLILAGIAIASLTGDNGLFARARQARQNTLDAQNAENATLEGYEDAIDYVLSSEAGTVITDIPEDWTSTHVTAISDGEGGVIPLPQEFSYVGGTKSEGIVVSDNPIDAGKGTSYEVTKTLQGNQFVWIPVQIAVCEEVIYLDEFINEEEAINALINKINTDTNKMGYPMSIKIVNGESVEYVSVLYNIDLVENLSEDNIYSVSFTAIPYSRENGSYREPDIASTADSFSRYLNIMNYDSIETFESELHAKYNEMIESVDKYGGFYVARYETTRSDESKEEDKNEGECCFKQQRDVIINKNWYEFYKMHEDYAFSVGNNIYSNSIWGCQWDQMMLFMKDIKNELDNNKPYIISGIGMATANGEISKSASNEKYSVKNIFDIAGNVYEYTLETRSATTHTKRSSCYRKEATPSANRRNYVIIQNDSNNGGIYDGGRCSFYIQ